SISTLLMTSGLVGSSVHACSPCEPPLPPSVLTTGFTALGLVSAAFGSLRPAFGSRAGPPRSMPGPSLDRFSPDDIGSVASDDATLGASALGSGAASAL